MRLRIDGGDRWETDPFGSAASEWDPVEGVRVLLSELPPGVFWVPGPAPTGPELPGPLDSRLLPPLPDGPSEPPSWADTLAAWANGWNDRAQPSARDVGQSAERLRQHMQNQRLYVSPLQTTFSDGPDGHVNLTTKRTGWIAPPLGGFELRTCCPEFMEGDTHSPTCYRIKDEERPMVPGNRSGGYDDGPCPGKELREAVLHKFRAGGIVTEQDLQPLFEKANRSKPKLDLDKVKAAPYVPPPIPERLRIGHATYTISTCERIPSQNDEDEVAGWSDAPSQRLEVATHGGPDYVRETLLHEILHLCLRATGTDPDADAQAGVTDVEERTLSGLTGPLLGALRDHPELLAYLTAPTPRDGVG